MERPVGLKHYDLSITIMLLTVYRALADKVNYIFEIIKPKKADEHMDVAVVITSYNLRPRKSVNYKL